MKNIKYQATNFFKSQGHARSGIKLIFKNERNFRIDLIVAIIVVILGFLFKISHTDWIAISLVISVVFVSETINSAIEAVVDLCTQEYHELAKFAKDAAAGAVFVAVSNAVIIGYLVFYNKFEDSVGLIIGKIRNSYVHVSVIALIVVITVVIGLKAYFRKGRPLRGGMPSGHSAVAFSIWSAVLFMTDNVYVIVMTLLLALLVAQTRVKAGIHSFKEVIFGGVVGAGITYLMLYFAQ